MFIFLFVYLVSIGSDTGSKRLGSSSNQRGSISNFLRGGDRDVHACLCMINIATFAYKHLPLALNAILGKTRRVANKKSSTHVCAFVISTNKRPLL